MNKYDQGWNQINTPIEHSRFGTWLMKRFWGFCIGYQKLTILVHSRTENRAYLAQLKSELLDMEGELHRLIVRSYHGNT